MLETNTTDSCIGVRSEGKWEGRDKYYITAAELCLFCCVTGCLLASCKAFMQDASFSLLPDMCSDVFFSSNICSVSSVRSHCRLLLREEFDTLNFGVLGGEGMGNIESKFWVSLLSAIGLPCRKKLSNFLHTQNWRGAFNYVAKQYIETVDRDVYFEDVRLQMEAKLWGEEYNRHKPPKQVPQSTKWTNEQEIQFFCFKGWVFKSSSQGLICANPVKVNAN